MKRILSLIFIGSMFFMFSAKMDASQFNTGFRFSNSSHRYHSRSYKKYIRKSERMIAGYINCEVKLINIKGNYTTRE